ncbi:MAG: ribokinase [Clostridia bacterium]|nr:ribokinase [Clostridia bacterium]
MKIYNLGSLNIDHVYTVDHFVRAGETIATEKYEIFPGGKGLNQSVALARAGAEVVHGALVGEGGEFLMETMAASGVDVSKIKRVSGSCGHAIIQVNKNGENCIMIHGGTNRALDKEYIEEFLSDAQKEDILLLQNETNCVAEAIEAAYSKGMTVAFNPSPFDGGIKYLPLDHVGIWFCNEIEGAELIGTQDTDGICRGFERKYPDSELILTLGEDGSVYCGRGERFSQKAYKNTVVDTTAAGDTFTGYYLASIAKGLSPEKAADIASKAASITISRPGASSSIPFADEV